MPLLTEADPAQDLIVLYCVPTIHETTTAPGTTTQCGGGAVPFGRFNTTTIPRRGCTTSRAGITTRWSSGSSMRTAIPAPVRDSLGTICLRIVGTTHLLAKIAMVIIIQMP